MKWNGTKSNSDELNGTKSGGMKNRGTLCERLSYFSYNGKNKNSFIIGDSNIFYFCSPLCLVGNFPLINKRTQEKNRSIAFNMYIFLYIHACDSFSFVSLSYFSYKGKNKNSFIIGDSNIFFFYSLPCLVHTVVYFI
jgi:hypothetical protein